MDDPISKEKSNYNEASFQILRLHEKWIEIESFIKTGRLIEWKFGLDGIWRELYADVWHTTNHEEIISKNDKMRELVATSKTRLELYENLNKRHLFLKKLQDEVGKGGSWSDGTENDFD